MLQSKITANRIAERIENFWGYGSLSAPVWFVGMEEAIEATGDAFEKELDARFRASEGRQTIDLRKDMTEVPAHLKWFAPYARGSLPPIQRSWLFPIAFYLFLCGPQVPRIRPKPTENIREYLGKVLGDIDLCQSAGLELSPLPRQDNSETTWRYYRNFGFDLEDVNTRRAAALKALVETHRPRLVIFYSSGYSDFWRTIVGRPLTEHAPGLSYSRNAETAFCGIPHRESRQLDYGKVAGYADVLHRQRDWKPCEGQL